MLNIHDTIIIGGGMAGMSAAIYTRRAGRDMLLIEKNFLGGQIISASEVENYPGIRPLGGFDFAEEMSEQIERLDIKKISDEVVSLNSWESDGHQLWQVSCKKASYLCRTVIIAVGTISRKLSLPEEKRYVGRGVSYCATCDGAFFKNKVTAVAGGGNSALEEALYLSLLCRKVYLIHRHHHLRGELSLQKRITEIDNIEVIPDTEVVHLHGDRELKSIEISTDTHHSSRRNVSVLDVNGLFVAIGRIPQNSIFAGLTALDENGYIVAGEDCAASAKGIFAAGDCRTKEVRQLVTAAADGATAASSAIKYIEKEFSRFH